MASVTITPTVPQAGITLVTVTGAGFTAGQVLSVETVTNQYGSNWVLPDGTVETAARMERWVQADPTGAWNFQYMPSAMDLGSALTVKVRPVAEQFLDTTPIATASFSPSQPNT